MADKRLFIELPDSPRAKRIKKELRRKAKARGMFLGALTLELLEAQLEKGGES